MTEKAQLILSELKSITPINIHQKTTADQSLKDSFHSVWYKHSPQAARYMLLPYLYNEKINLIS